MTAQRVLDAAAAMEFVSEGAVEVRTDDYGSSGTDWALGPAAGAAQVAWSRTTRPLDEVVDEVADGFATGPAGVAWWVSPASQQAGTGRRCAPGVPA